MFQDSVPVPLAAVTVNCLLSKDSALQSAGAALVSNIARYQVPICLRSCSASRFVHVIRHSKFERSLLGILVADPLKFEFGMIDDFFVGLEDFHMTLKKRT